MKIMTIVHRLAVRLGAVLLLTAGLGVPAYSASSEWQDLGGGKGRILAVVDPKSNALKGVLEIRLKPGWSTYWRYPGSSGLPPKLDFSRSAGLAIKGIGFTAPQLLENGGIRYAGYKNSAYFPFEGVVNQPGKAWLHLDLMIGVCEDVCIPAQAKMEIGGPQLLQSDPKAESMISLTALRRPKKVTPQALNAEKFERSGDILEISLELGADSVQPNLFVEGPQEWYLTPARHVAQEGRRHTFHLDVSQVPDRAAVLSTPLTYTLVAEDKGVEFEY